MLGPGGEGEDICLSGGWEDGEGAAGLASLGVGFNLDLQPAGDSLSGAGVLWRAVKGLAGAGAGPGPGPGPGTGDGSLAPVLAAGLGVSGFCRSARSDWSTFSLTLPLPPLWEESAGDGVTSGFFSSGRLLMFSLLAASLLEMNAAAPLVLLLSATLDRPPAAGHLFPSVSRALGLVAGSVLSAADAGCLLAPLPASPEEAAAVGAVFSLAL